MSVTCGADLTPRASHGALHPCCPCHREETSSSVVCSRSGSLWDVNPSEPAPRSLPGTAGRVPLQGAWGDLWQGLLSISTQWTSLPGWRPPRLPHPAHLYPLAPPSVGASPSLQKSWSNHRQSWFLKSGVTWRNGHSLLQSTENPSLL